MDQPSTDQQLVVEPASNLPSNRFNRQLIVPATISATALVIFIALAITLPSRTSLFQALFPKPSSRADTTPPLDLVSFMAAHFNQNGYTDTNSYLAFTGHNYNSQTGTWTHLVSTPTCPYPNQTAQTCQPNWEYYYLGRQDATKQIIYQSKSSFAGKNLETFWYNNDWIYDLAEPVPVLNSAYCDPYNSATLSCQHTLAHAPTNPAANPFPNRGFIWFKRYVHNGDQLTIPALTAQYFRGLTSTLTMDNYTNPLCANEPANCVAAWPQTTAVVYYVPNWNFTATSPITWDGKPDTGNLSPSLNVIILQTTTYTPTTQIREKYYYAKAGDNSYGLVRYDLWQPIASPKTCSGHCQPNAITENGWVLTTYNTFNLLTKFADRGLNPADYFKRTFNADPKLEPYPGPPANNHQFRGAFTIPGTTQQVQLTDIPIDTDYLIAYHDCPNGYKQVGAIVTSDMTDYQGTHYHDGASLYWTIFCGTTTKVALATTCPANYISRYAIHTPSPSTQAYDYQAQAVGGTPLQFCVSTDETKISNQPLFPST